MVDDQYRGLLTDREREILSGEADVSESYHARVISRVRNKIDHIEKDKEILEENEEEILKELQDSIC